MSADNWIWQLDRIIPSTAEDCRDVVEELLDQLRQRNWDERDLFGIHLSCEEALMNALKHGNRMDASKKIEVSCRISDDKVRVEIADEGEGFDPEAIPDPTDDEYLDMPSGRGVMLMRNFMTRVEYLEGGTRVVMEKERS
ncbi:MAG TPA: ATP-binding protein [Planctomycetes bacterium]|nr:ATP-binding protein [Planctomycetota bacterium]